MALAPEAMADNAFLTSQRIWRLMDVCTEQAQKAFPDYTHEGRVQREAYRFACMRANNLPYGGDNGGALPYEGDNSGTALAPFASQMQQTPQLQQQQMQQQLMQQMQGTLRH